MADLQEQQKRASDFRNLHSSGKMLLLPNAWDVASARIVEAAGFPAIATTSGGIAFSLGYPDGQQIPREEMLAVVARIARAVRVPVTADVEAGYGSRPEDSAQTARAVIEAGAVGLNLEDAPGEAGNPMVELSQQLERLHAMREAAAAMKVPLVLNARTEVYLLPPEQQPPKPYDETLRRLTAYRDAGADCVFAPGLRDLVTIKRLFADLKCPLNILVGPQSPSIAELKDAGVARVSLGSGPMRASLGVLRNIAKELTTTGTYESLANAPSYAEMNELLRTES